MSEASNAPSAPHKVSDLLAKVPERITHTGRIVTLVPFTPSQADDLFEVIGGEQNASLWDRMTIGPFLDKEKFRGTMERLSKSNDPVFFVIISNCTHKPLGIIALVSIHPEKSSVELGPVVFSAALQRTPGATEAIYMLSRHAFEDLGYRRFEWKCDANNTASRRAAQRVGFVHEGVLRQGLYMKDRFWDVAMFSILESEWPQCRRAFVQWLDPNNFDSEGRQKSPLASLREIQS